jgi:hypothetical protein
MYKNMEEFIKGIRESDLRGFKNQLQDWRSPNFII